MLFGRPAVIDKLSWRLRGSKRNGRKALDHLTRSPPRHHICFSVKLAGLSGVAWCCCVRSHGRHMRRFKAYSFEEHSRLYDGDASFSRYSYCTATDSHNTRAHEQTCTCLSRNWFSGTVRCSADHDGGSTIPLWPVGWSPRQKARGVLCGAVLMWFSSWRSRPFYGRRHWQEGSRRREEQSSSEKASAPLEAAKEGPPVLSPLSPPTLRALCNTGLRQPKCLREPKMVRSRGIRGIPSSSEERSAHKRILVVFQPRVAARRHRWLGRSPEGPNRKCEVRELEVRKHPSLTAPTVTFLDAGPQAVFRCEMRVPIGRLQMMCSLFFQPGWRGGRNSGSQSRHACGPIRYARHLEYPLRTLGLGVGGCSTFAWCDS